MNDGDISSNTTNEVESMSEDEKMLLYARAVHSNHSIQYHVHQIMERQRVVDEYRDMTMEGMDLIPLESNLHKFHQVIISQIINMIESDNFWHRKTFESVMSDLWNMWTEGIQELENAHSHVFEVYEESGSDVDYTSCKTILNYWYGRDLKRTVYFGLVNLTTGYKDMTHYWPWLFW